MKRILIAAALAAFANVAAQATPLQNAPQDTRTFTDPDGFRAQETPGGYQPAGSPLSGPVSADTKVVFVPQALTPSEAYPAPAPRKSYPACKLGQQDNCRQAR